ncbi:SgcJ/EcaC family oxidoreductase [Promicromonospora sp. NPDC050262]|uniref:SgcJ/EcaC family oxidoreductase n=1 Tax=Promicromonospora sp. NPDC050262 TaxID=3155036 RepID=UPI0033F3821D
MVQHDTSEHDTNERDAIQPGDTAPGDTAFGDATAVISALLDRWSDGIRRRDLAHIAAQFTEDALFQGFDPEPSFGRDAVSAYYGKQPAGLTADYTLIRTSALGDHAALGYAAVAFHRPGGPVNVFLTVVAVREEGSWLISHYHVSRVQ